MTPIVFVVLWISPSLLSGAAVIQYSTTFDGDENPLSEGGKWVNHGLDWTKIQKAHGLAYGTQTGTNKDAHRYDDSYAHLAGFPPDQEAWAQARITKPNPACHQELEILLRWTSEAHCTSGYECFARCVSDSSSYVQIVRWEGPLGKFTYLADKHGADYGLKDGDVLKAAIVGDVITVSINGVEKARVKDDTYKTGNPGIGTFLQCDGGQGTASNADFGFKSFTARAVTEKEQVARHIMVTVDPRVELMSVIFRLAGSPEYNQGQVPSYVQDVDSHFSKFRDHPAVTLARKLRQTQSIGYDAVMGMAVHMTDTVSLQEKIPFAPQPGSLDGRWTPETAREFLDLARKFVVDTRFKDFLAQHEPLYQVGVQRMQEMLDQHAHLEWFDKFFGSRPSADFHVVVGLLIGVGNYGVHVTRPEGREELYSIIGMGMIDAQGQPICSPLLVPIIVHEFTHSYTNALVDRFAGELQDAGEKLYPLVAAPMRRQAYSNWKTMMYESLNRACVLRYVLATSGPAALRWAAWNESMRSFYWVGELAELLAEYDAEPRRYADLAQFFPKVIAFCNDYAKNADAKLGFLKAAQEK